MNAWRAWIYRISIAPWADEIDLDIFIQAESVIFPECFFYFDLRRVEEERKLQPLSLTSFDCDGGIMDEAHSKLVAKLTEKNYL